MPQRAGNTGNFRTSFSYYVFDHLRTKRAVFSDLIAYVPLSFQKFSMRAAALPEEVSGDTVSGNFFSGLGMSPASGRLLTAGDERTHSQVAVISYQFWTRRYARSATAIGKTIDIRGVPFTVVGVAPARFTGLGADPRDLWIPLQVRPDFNAWGMPGKSYVATPDWWCILMIGRLRHGLTREAAQAALAGTYEEAAYGALGGKAERGERPSQLTLVQARGVRGADDFRQQLLVLQSMVGVLLLIACGNVSMLLAVRNAARGREFSVRLALGSSRGRLVRQLLTEACVMTGSGAFLGFLLSLLVTRVLARWAQLRIDITPDTAVLWFTLVISAACVLIFALLPVRSAARARISESLKTSSATAYRGHARFPADKIVSCLQVGMCLTLLICAGVLVRTLQNLQHVDLGMNTHGLLVFGLTPHFDEKQKGQENQFYRSLMDRLRTVPGVESVTLTGNRLASGWSNNTDAVVDGRTPKYVPDTMLRWNNVGPDFFTTLGVPLLAGRDFSYADTAASPNVAIVNQTFVRRLMKGRNPLGHTVSFTSNKAFTIVGLVPDNKYTAIREDPVSMAWFPYTQVGSMGAADVEVRTDAPAGIEFARLRRAVAEVAPDLALIKPATQQAEFDDTISNERLLAKLSGAFAALAMALVMIGLYGSIAFSVARRTSEIGVRMALGAERSTIIKLILRESGLLVVIGLVLGFAGAIAGSRLLSAVVYGVSAMDPASLGLAGIALIVAALASSLIPARRAAALDPVRALRQE